MDDLGNRSGDQTLRDDGTVNFAVDTVTNRYTAVGGSSLAYDDAGNLATDKDGYAYIYDYENRIVKIKDDQQTPIAEFAYDTQGRRIQKKVYEVGQLSYTSDYYYSDQWQVLTEVRIWPGYDPAVCTFVYGNYIDEVLQHTWTTPGGTSRRYLLHDHLYSPVVLMSDAGAIWQRYEYDAYGRRSAFTATFAPSTLDYGNDIAFTGRELDILDDGGLKLMDYRHRAYDTYAGRFMQQDPLGINPAGGLNNLFDAQKQYSDGMSLFQYISGNPIMFRDPTGLWLLKEHQDLTIGAMGKLGTDCCHKCLLYPFKFKSGLKNGSIYPDVPYGGDFWNITEGFLDSHWGSNIWWHMTTTSDAGYGRAEITRDKVIDKVVSFGQTIRSMSGNCYRQGELLGEILHSIEDSFCPSHVYRNGAGQIRVIQNYLAQDGKKHSTGDTEEGNETEYELAMNAAAKVMKLIMCEEEFDAIKLRNVLRNEILILAPNAVAGGTLRKYKSDDYTNEDYIFDF